MSHIKLGCDVCKDLCNDAKCLEKYPGWKCECASCMQEQKRKEHNKWLLIEGICQISSKSVVLFLNIIDISDNVIVKLENFPYLKRLTTLLINNKNIDNPF